jgi:methylthioribose-1-phosphate isomerase
MPPSWPPPWSPGAALSGASYSAAELAEDGSRVFLLDQRRLPSEERYLAYDRAADVAAAIAAMVVRGAPAIGIAAAYGLAVEAHHQRSAPEPTFSEELLRAAAGLAAARPTAVNLRWAVEQGLSLVRAGGRAEALAELARRIHRDDVAACRGMGRIGAAHLPDEGTVLTHCNAGALATGGYGTALGVIRAARELGKRIRVLADETRPYLQGARLTAWELAKDDIPVELITDGMVGHFMRLGAIQAVVVGADRIARNGDVANKIGTYGVACLARHHHIPFYVAAPWSTVDLATETGSAIPIEERSSEEVVVLGGIRLAPEGVRARHPGFDVTPAALIDGIFTERGFFAPSQLAGG